MAKEVKTVGSFDDVEAIADQVEKNNHDALDGVYKTLEAMKEEETKDDSK